MKNLSLGTPIEELYMVGPTYAKRLKKIQINTVRDLLYHFPFRYEDYSHHALIAKTRPEQTVTVRGRISDLENIFTKNRKKIQKATVADGSGQLAVIWFNQPFITQNLQKGDLLSLSGKIGWFGRTKSMISPEYEVIQDKQKKTHKMNIHTGRLVPVYPTTYGLSSKWLRYRIAPLLTQGQLFKGDLLPQEIRDRESLSAWNEAINMIHFPENQQEIEKARQRFAFEEMLLIHLRALDRQKEWQEKKATLPLAVKRGKMVLFQKSLPFKLTGAQERVIHEINHDLAKEKPMNRLLQGDVGSGKTVVAAAAIFTAFQNQVQAALMAPTEILAQQHFQTIKEILGPLNIRVELLTGSSRKPIDNFDLAIGTHALIHTRANFKKLGLVIIDEQHRFGVAQRGKLIRKGQTPHLLTMTATPIPRTIALTLYADLDLSRLDEMPPGRQKIKTWLVPPQKRKAAYRWMEKQIKQEHSQAFIICPLVEESDHETMRSVRAVSSEYERLQKRVFPKLKLGLLHGRIKSREKSKVIQQLKDNKIDILVATPVVEVGLDVPNATIMLIEASERFGLAQLHQLRGRVGRGRKQSYCLLFTEKWGTQSSRRLKALEKTQSGLELAEIDLKSRGPGEIYGTAQHGFLNLKVADFNDHRLIKKTKDVALDLFDDLSAHPLLKQELKKDKISTVEAN